MDKRLDPTDDDETPEWTEEDFAKARPFKEVFPEFYANWKAGRVRVRVLTPEEVAAEKKGRSKKPAS
ncbi:MAG TPA: hypothetical protein VJY39_03510 [Acidisphaera sp.]|nr:hypothetical protein [Acidisphaera sp.]